jgi:hypothetical protein
MLSMKSFAQVTGLSRSSVVLDVTINAIRAGMGLALVAGRDSLTAYNGTILRNTR